MAFKLKSFIKSRISRVASNVKNVGENVKGVVKKVEKADKFLQNLGKSGTSKPGTSKPKLGIKEKMDRKYGTGEYRIKKQKGIGQQGGKRHLRMKPGESKFQYDVRMRKEGRQTTTESTSKENYVEVNENDLRQSAIVSDSSNLIEGITPLESEPGDPYQYRRLDGGGYEFKLGEGEWKSATGDAYDAIEARYKDIEIEDTNIKKKK